jgi:hypothetical protein
MTARRRRTPTVARTLSTLAACALTLCTAASAASAQGRDQDTDRRERAGIFLEPGWHPYLAIGPAVTLGRLGDLSDIGVSAHLGAWLIQPDVAWPGLGIEASYATFSRNTSEPLPGRYQIAGASLRITSKGKQRIFFDWLGGYGSIGAGVFRHGASGATTRTAAGVTGSVGMLVPIAGREGFIETRVQHLFSGETLGRGNGLTFAPLLFGVRF